MALLFARARGPPVAPRFASGVETRVSAATSVAVGGVVTAGMGEAAEVVVQARDVGMRFAEGVLENVQGSQVDDLAVLEPARELVGDAEIVQGIDDLEAPGAGRALRYRQCPAQEPLGAVVLAPHPLQGAGGIESAGKHPVTLGAGGHPVRCLESLPDPALSLLKVALVDLEHRRLGKDLGPTRVTRLETKLCHRQGAGHRPVGFVHAGQGAEDAGHTGQCDRRQSPAARETNGHLGRVTEGRESRLVVSEVIVKAAELEQRASVLFGPRATGRPDVLDRLQGKVAGLGVLGCRPQGRDRPLERRLRRTGHARSGTVAVTRRSTRLIAGS